MGWVSLELRSGKLDGEKVDVDGLTDRVPKEKKEVDEAISSFPEDWQALCIFWEVFARPRPLIQSLRTETDSCVLTRLSSQLPLSPPFQFPNHIQLSVRFLWNSTSSLSLR